VARRQLRVFEGGQSLSDLGTRADAEPSVIGDHRLDQLEIGLAGTTKMSEFVFHRSG
jgi:hypothetical protein